MSQQELDQAAEGIVRELFTQPNSDPRTPASATRAYKQAISTLTALRAHPSQHIFDAALASSNGNSKSIFSSFLPNLQGQGPIGSAFRIILKIHQHTFNRVGNSFSKDGFGLGSKRKDEELRGKAIKVVDLLQHSAELGNMDALYTLAQVSLVRVCRCHLNKIIINFRIVSSYPTLHDGSPTGIPITFHPRLTDRKCNLPSLFNILSCYGL